MSQLVEVIIDGMNVARSREKEVPYLPVDDAAAVLETVTHFRTLGADVVKVSDARRHRIQIHALFSSHFRCSEREDGVKARMVFGDFKLKEFSSLLREGSMMDSCSSRFPSPKSRSLNMTICAHLQKMFSPQILILVLSCRYANRKGGFIVSNDRFLDHTGSVASTNFLSYFEQTNISI